MSSAVHGGAAGYYADLTEYYLRYGDGFHFGVWDDGVESHQAALTRSSSRLLEGLGLSQDSRVLDAGCGVGTLAVMCAQAYGARTLGISLVADHAGRARRLALERGVIDRCDFHLMDMEALALRPRTFDLVVNQESFCHVVDKPRYLASVFEILRPGGTWSAQLFALRAGALTRGQRRVLDRVRSGFHVPDLMTAPELTEALRCAGFEDVTIEDLSARVSRTARYIIRSSRPARLVTLLHLDWLVFHGGARARKNKQGHFRAGTAFSRGLLDGYFRMLAVRARKPR